VKRRFALLCLVAGVPLCVITFLAFFRGFVATDLFTLSLARPSSPNAWIEYKVVLVTSHSICAIVYGRVERRATSDASAARVDRVGVSHDAHLARPATLFVHDRGTAARRLGFQSVVLATSRWDTPWGTMQRNERGVLVPTWFVTLLAAGLIAPAAFHLRRERRKRHRRAAGECESCGYDLRGAAHERCPECGADVVATSV
jgi:hypothetical protein